MMFFEPQININIGMKSTRRWCTELNMCLSKKEQEYLGTPNSQCDEKQDKCLQENKIPPGTSPNPLPEQTPWYPRLASFYGRTDNVHWSVRADGDLLSLDGRPAFATQRRPAVRDFYEREDADAAFLGRKPVSFVVFGKPGVPDGELATALAAHWGCVHVSVAGGLAAGRASNPATLALRCGGAVTAGHAGSLTKLLGLDTTEVQQRGYVLTGLPRYDSLLNAHKQINAVFTTNPPDVLIYIHFPNRDLYNYRDGYVLKSMKHDCLTQTLHLKDGEFTWNNPGYAVRWYRSSMNGIVAELELESYERNAVAAVEEAVKQFDPVFVVTVDGRRPVNELLETVKARLATLPVRPPALPEILQYGKPVTSIDEAGMADAGIDEASVGMNETAGMEETVFDVDEAYRSAAGINETDGSTTGMDEANEAAAAAAETGRDAAAAHLRREQTRTLSEFGPLCPVNFANGVYTLGSQRYRVKFMDKMYTFAGVEEMQLFVKHPNRYLDIPRTGLPIKAVFYGPELLVGPAAKALCKLFGCELIDVMYTQQVYDDIQKRMFFTAIVDTMLSHTHTVYDERLQLAKTVATLRDAVGKWLELNFGYGMAGQLSDLEQVNDQWIGNEMSFEDCYSDEHTTSFKHSMVKTDQLTSIKHLLESYDVRITDDFDACVRAYDEPDPVLRVCVMNKWETERKRQTADLLRAKAKARPFDVTDVVIENVRVRNANNKHWVIINASPDMALVRKLMAADLNPIQFVFFRDADPSHEALLRGEMSTSNLWRLVWKDFDDFRTGNGDGAAASAARTDNTELAVDEPADVDDDDWPEETDGFGEEIGVERGHDRRVVGDADAFTHDQLVAFVMPEITRRLDEYAADLLALWQNLKSEMPPNEEGRYMDFCVIECKADPKTNPIETMIRDTLYHIKKFVLPDNVYDVSAAPDDPDAAAPPEPSMHDGHTSVYCPVSYAHGKLAVGSRRHAAVYRNRYYYARSARHLRAFAADPYRYAGPTGGPGPRPRPRIAVLCSPAVDPAALVDDLAAAFGLTVMDWRRAFAELVLAADRLPMLGELYEHPAFRWIVDEHFAPAGWAGRLRLNRLRRYVDRRSVRLDDRDWTALSSAFARCQDGVCGVNFPRNATELAYLCDDGAGPDAIVHAVADDDDGGGGGGDDGRKKRDRAAETAVAERLVYQYAILDRIVELDEAARRDVLARRRALFRDELAAATRAESMDRLKKRVRRVVDAIAAEAEDVEGRPAAVANAYCGDDGRRTSVQSPSSPFRSWMSGLTLAQKKTIIDYGLTVRQLSAIEDVAVLDRIRRLVDDRVPDTEFLLPKCFADKPVTTPSDATIDRHVAAADADIATMRQYARSAGVPWLTVSAGRYTRADVIGRVAAATATAAVDDESGDSGNAFSTASKVDPDAAERMLRAGRVHLSRFGRWCPVRLRDDPDALQRYYADSRAGRIHAVVHGPYVYYLSGTENRDRFIGQPLEYATLESFSTPHADKACGSCDIPLRIAVVGAPGVGKSYCAEKLCAQYGFQLIRVEHAVESYMSELAWTDGAKSAARQLRRGDALSDMALTEAMNAAMFAERAVVQGFVLDGYPATAKQFEHMDAIGVIVHRVLIVDGPPNDSYEPDTAWLRHRRRVWAAEFAGESWISERYGNVVAVKDYNEATASVQECAVALSRYRAGMYEDRPCRLADVPVTDSERRNRLSTYLDLCPVCRTDGHRLNRPADPVTAERHLTQYRARFYWVCADHWATFAGGPAAYVDAAPSDDNGPELLPEPVTEQDVADNPYTLCKNVFTHCVVCALGHGRQLWSPVYRRGYSFLMATYGKYTYAFCSPMCRHEFMCRPFLYVRYRQRVSGPEHHVPSPLPVHRLPVLGYLEQTVGPAAGAAVRALSVVRPVYPGHTAAVSAALFLGLFVGGSAKNTDEDGDSDVTEYYQALHTQFVRTCHRFKMAVIQLKSLI